MKDQLALEVKKALKSRADQKTIDASQRFFKAGEKARVHGVKAAEVRKIAREYYQKIKNESKTDVFELCEELWKSAYLEEAVIACVWSESQQKNYAPSDFQIFQRWVDQYVDNWAACDTLCNHTIGTFIMMYPEYLQELKKWAKSSNRWARRAAAVTLIVPARKGMFLEDIFKIADILLTDSDHMVQKGYGWMLKAASQVHEKEVFAFVITNKAMMPRTALRYAIEKMSVQRRVEAMQK